METETKAIIGVAVGMMLFVVGLIVYAIQGERAKNAWVAACNAKGGIAVPTERIHTKGGTSYGGWICAKLQVIEVK